MTIARNTHQSVMDFWVTTMACASLLLASTVMAQTNVDQNQSAQKAVAVEAIRATEHIGQNRYALTIGINDYSDPLVPDLATCENDARALHSLLTDPSTGGVETSHATLLLGKQATTRNIRKALTDLRRIAEVGDVSGALLTANSITNNNKAYAMRRIAHAQAQADDVLNALGWINALTDPQVKALALVGIADGLLVEVEKQ